MKLCLLTILCVTPISFQLLLVSYMKLILCPIFQNFMHSQNISNTLIDEFILDHDAPPGLYAKLTSAPLYLTSTS